MQDLTQTEMEYIKTILADRKSGLRTRFYRTMEEKIQNKGSYEEDLRRELEQVTKIYEKLKA